MEQFTKDELDVLSKFASNTDRDIFCLINLPEAIKGALFSRYSRSTKSLRRLLLDEFIKDPETGFQEMVSFDVATGEKLAKAIGKAEAFYDRVLTGYGDDSVGELGGAHIAIENCSNLATKVLQDARLGGSPLEKSTRYVFFDEKENGDYKFYKEPKIMDSSFDNEYLEVMRLLFDTYAGAVEKMKGHVMESFPLEKFDFFDPAVGRLVKFSDIKDEKMAKRAEIAYKSSVRAKACDVLRYLLPASTLTNCGIYGNGRFYQSLMAKMYSNPLSEIQELSKNMHRELNTIILPFIKRAKQDEFLVSQQTELGKVSQELLQNERMRESDPVTLVDYDKNAEMNVLAALLYPNSRLSMPHLKEMVKQMSYEDKKKLLNASFEGRRNRRDKPLRAFEYANYEFDLLGDFGIYRDLQRHRVLTQQRQDLTITHGYELPEELIDVGLKKEFDYCMKAAADLYKKVYTRFPREAQYVVPFAYRIRWSVKFNMREAFHLIELRSGVQGHPAYRRMVQQMFKKIEYVHPLLAGYMKFVDFTPALSSFYLKYVDMQPYALGRLQSEMKKEEKLEKFQEKAPVKN